jgi:hypothetical protein
MIEVQLIPLFLRKPYQLSSGAIAMIREQLDREVKECQHEFVMLDASSRTEHRVMIHGTF